MSAKVMGQVYDYELSATERAVLMAIADHADHEGANAFPSLALIAWKVGMTERGVWGIVRRLRLRGALVQQRPPGFHRPTTFRIVLSALPRKAPFERNARSEQRSYYRPRSKGEPDAGKDERPGLGHEQARSYEPSSETSFESSRTQAGIEHDHSEALAAIADGVAKALQWPT